MKSFEIINHILDLPNFAKLKSFNETTSVLKSMLGRNLAGLIKFAYQKEQNSQIWLFIAVLSPLAMHELKHDSNIFLISSLLKKYCELNPTSKIKKPDQIRFFIPKTSGISKNPIFGLYNLPKISNLPKGEFENTATDPQIYEAFETIRNIIKNANKRA